MTLPTLRSYLPELPAALVFLAALVLSGALYGWGWHP